MFQLLIYCRESMNLVSVDLSNKEELPMDTNTDLDNKVHGERIRQATAFHESVRLTHGK